MTMEDNEHRLCRPDRADEPWALPDGGTTALSWTQGRLGVKPKCVPGVREI